MARARRIAEFLKTYIPEGVVLRLSGHEEALVAAALEEFLLLDQWLTDEDTRAWRPLSEQLRAKMAETALDAPISELIKAVEELEAQLERREEANMIMREHVMMMSEKIAGLRAAAPQT